MAKPPDVSRQDLLEQIVARRRPELLRLLSLLGKVKLSEDQREALREVVASEFTEVGLSDQDEPNSYGRVLEELIDWIGHQ